MSRGPRRDPSATFKAKVALDAVKGSLAIPQFAHKLDAHPYQVIG